MGSALPNAPHGLGKGNESKLTKIPQRCEALRLQHEPEPTERHGWDLPLS